MIRDDTVGDNGVITRRSGTITGNNERPTGLTKDTGWQIGARRTLAVQHHRAWVWLTSEAGTAQWLGAAVAGDLAEDTDTTLADGTAIRMAVFNPEGHLRLRRLPPGGPRPATVQVRTIDKGDRCVVAFHEEHLPDEAARTRRRTAYHATLAALACDLGG